MKRILVSPSRYVQGEGELLNLATCIEDFGTQALLVASKEDHARVKTTIEKSLNGTEIKILSGGFNEECSRAEIERLGVMANENKVDVIIGLGGGKALDVAKSVSHFQKKPVIVIPTIASTDAPCSSLAVIYTQEGEFEEYLFFKKNPDLVLVDTGIIAKAPTRFLLAGIGDALATYFEARSCEQSFALNIPGGNSTKAALALAKLCYNTLLEDASKAKAACDCNVVTPALENIVEANILLSGLGFESSGLAAAHAIHNGLTVLEETHKYFHGEKVSFGTIVHLILENAPKKEIEEVLDFCKELKLPICFKDLGVNDITPEKLTAVAKASVAPGETIHNMPFPVSESDVYSALVAADKLGSEYKK